MASRRKERRRACGRKDKFDTLQQAAKVAKRVGWITGEWLTAYKCRFCGKHHYGHPPKSVRQSLIAQQQNAAQSRT